MKDRVPQKPGVVSLTPLGGDLYKLERRDEPTETGTPLNKGTLLKDTTAAAYGLGNTATPDDVLEKLKASVLYQDGVLKTVLGNGVSVCQTGFYTGTGTYGYDNPIALNFGIDAKIVLFSRKQNVSGLSHYLGCVDVSLFKKLNKDVGAAAQNRYYMDPIYTEGAGSDDVDGMRSFTIHRHNTDKDSFFSLKFWRTTTTFINRTGDVILWVAIG